MGLNHNIPCFRRAREYHLFDDRGRRFLDLYQNDGRAIMGHRPGKFSQFFKNSISRGMWADYPGPLDKRLEKLLHLLFPDYSFIRVFRNQERAKDVLKIVELKDPLDGEGEALYWRPQLPEHPDCSFLFLRLPVPGLIETQIVLAKKELPEGDEVSPIAIEGIIRLLHDYRNWSARGISYEDFTTPQRLAQRGPYLSWIETPDNFDEIFQKALEKGLLFPPNPKYPLLIPSELSDYENKTLRTFLEEIHR